MDTTALETPAPVEALRDRLTGRFQPGNPGGKLREGKRNIQGLLDEAIKSAQTLRNKLKEPCLCVRGMWMLASPERKPAIYKRSCRTIDQHFARRAFLDDTILSAFQKKRIPDLQHQTGETGPRIFNVIHAYRA